MPTTSSCASRRAYAMRGPTPSSAAAARPIDATHSGRRGWRSTSGPAPTTPMPMPSTERRAEQSGAREIEGEIVRERGLVRADEHEHAAECEEGRKAERKHALASDHAEIEPRRLGHHARIPGRIPDEIELDALTPATLRALLSTSGGSCSATGHIGEVSVMRTPTCAGVVDVDVVDQAELVDVDGDLRVEDGAQRLDHALADRVGAARRARSRLPLGRGRPRSCRSLVRFVHVAHSVVAGARLPCSAARSVCQASVAHFTRTGNSRTPAKHRELAELRVGGRRRRSAGHEPVEALEELLGLLDASCPSRASVISDAEAVEIAQPRPSKRDVRHDAVLDARRKTVSWSPHSGLWPSACAVRVRRACRSSAAACCGRG